MRHKKLAIALIVSALAAGGTAAATNADAPFDDFGVLSTGDAADVSISADHSLNQAVVDDYGLDLSRARVASDGGSRGTGTWIVIPGDNGLCLVPGDASLSCAPAAGAEDGQLAMTTLPVPEGTKYVPGQPIPIGAGSGKVQGIVPDDIVRVIGVNSRGDQIATTSVTSNVYELEVLAFKDLAEVRLEHRDGSESQLNLGLDSR